MTLLTCSHCNTSPSSGFFLILVSLSDLGWVLGCGFMLSLVGVLSLHGGSVVDICLPQQCLTFLIREIVQFLSSVAVNLVTYGCKIRSFLDVETKWVPLRSPVSQIVEIDVLVTCGNQDTVYQTKKKSCEVDRGWIYWILFVYHWIWAWYFVKIKFAKSTLNFKCAWFCLLAGEFIPLVVEPEGGKMTILLLMFKLQTIFTIAF